MREFVQQHRLTSKVLAAFLVIYGIIAEMAGLGEGMGYGRDICLEGLVPLAIGFFFVHYLLEKESESDSLEPPTTEISPS